MLGRLVKIIVDRRTFCWGRKRKINGSTYGNAIDVDDQEIIAIHVSTTRTSLDALYF